MYNVDYAQGFMDKCASYGVDPEKLAQDMLGRVSNAVGGAYQTMMPQWGKDRIGNWAASKRMANPQGTQEMIPDKGGQIVGQHMNYQTNSAGNNVNQNFQHNIKRLQGGTAGSYGNQMLAGLAQGQFPQLMRPGSPVQMHTAYQQNMNNNKVDEQFNKTMLPAAGPLPGNPQ